MKALLVVMRSSLVPLAVLKELDGLLGSFEVLLINDLLHLLVMLLLIMVVVAMASQLE